jgi:tRNA(fMet)-specific endonuclease VapC
MTQYLFDTNHVGMFFRRDNHLAAKVAAHRDDHFGVSLPTVAELWFMVYNSQRRQENINTLERLLSAYTQWPFDAQAARVFGQTKTLLRRMGKTVADVDLQIVSIALVNDLTILTADKAFANVPNLRTENWLT